MLIEQRGDSPLKRDALFQSIAARTRNRLVINAFARVDRKIFAPSGHPHVYEDRTIQLGDGSSISQPTLVAEMMDWSALTGRGTVLEIGTGSGYQAALLACCTDQVYTVEYNPVLASSARQKLAEAGFSNVSVIEGDGILGLPDREPFDAIIVTAGLREAPRDLLFQLNGEFGRFIAPVGQEDPDFQDLLILTRLNGKHSTMLGSPVQFHPLMSQQKGGWTREQIAEAVREKRDFVAKIMEESGLTQEAVQRRILFILGKPVPIDLLPEIYPLKQLRLLKARLGKYQNQS